jgi:hypothetical protein
VNSKPLNADFQAYEGSPSAAAVCQVKIAISTGKIACTTAPTATPDVRSRLPAPASAA